jgi:hypothetical protein
MAARCLQGDQVAALFSGEVEGYPVRGSLRVASSDGLDQRLDLESAHCRTLNRLFGEYPADF